MEKPHLPAAYQGQGWLPRQASLAQEVAAGTIWTNYANNSEWAPLRAVLLHIPSTDTPAAQNYNQVQHLAAIDYQRLHSQLDHLAETYTQLGIKVHVIPTSPANFPQKPTGALYNLMYVRDLFFMTPEGAIVSRMASDVRAGEEPHAARALSQLGVPIARTIGGQGTFEGADALWVNPTLVLLGCGNRTNLDGVRQIAACLKAQNVKSVPLLLPDGIQHLLGLLQIVDKDLAFARAELIPEHLRGVLSRQGIELVGLKESVEIKQQQALNFVSVGPRKIVMVSGNPATREIYRRHGIEIAAEVESSELLKGAGGLGCATGILQRG